MKMIQKCSQNKNVDVDRCFPKWVIVMAKIFGVWPFSTTSKSTATFRTRIGACLWSAITFIIYASCIYIQCSTQYLLYYLNMSPIEVIISSVMVIGSTVVLLLNIPLAFWNRQQFWNFIKLIHDVDQEVKNFVFHSRIE